MSDEYVQRCSLIAKIPTDAERKVFVVAILRIMLDFIRKVSLKLWLNCWQIPFEDTSLALKGEKELRDVTYLNVFSPYSLNGD